MGKTARFVGNKIEPDVLLMLPPFFRSFSSQKIEDKTMPPAETRIFFGMDCVLECTRGTDV
jgi:hypothetical protein